MFHAVCVPLVHIVVDEDEAEEGDRTVLICAGCQTKVIIYSYNDFTLIIISY